MRKIKFGIIVSFIIFILFFTGCLNNYDHRIDEEKIIGIWERVNFDFDQTWEFTEDGIIYISGSNLNISYVFFEGFLYIIYPDINYVDKHSYNFDNDVLTLELVAGAGAIDKETGEIIDLKDPSIISKFVFHRIS
jgi:hypothetical protein